MHRSSSGRADQPVTAPYRPVGVRRAARTAARCRRPATVLRRAAGRGGHTGNAAATNCGR